MPRREYYAAHRAYLADLERRAYYTRRGLDPSPKRATGRLSIVDPRPLVQRIPLAPIPDIDGHPLVDAAIAALQPIERVEIGTAMDSIARDLIGEYCLAAIAGEDPVAAVAAARSRHRRDRVVLIHGVLDGR